jgi:hypothetical protein
MKNYLKILIALAFGGMLLSSCKLVNDYVKPPKKNIYALVYDQKCNGNCAETKIILYKNNIATPISTSDSYAEAYFPTGMAIKGGNIYIVGYSGDYYGLKTIKYWKNEIETKITDGSKNAMPLGISIRGNEVFIYGYEGANTSGGSTSLLASYWSSKGVKHLTAVDKFTKSDAVTAMAVTTTETHMVGQSFDYNNNKIMYWKNDKPTVLAEYNGYANDISLNGTYVHIVGVANKEGSFKIIKYWKNGKEMDINSGNNKVYDPKISFNGKDVYSAWEESYIMNSESYSKIKLWKNGITTTLTENRISYLS